MDPPSVPDDEWEYEYDYDQTDEHYIVVDIPQGDAPASKSEGVPSYEKHIFGAHTSTKVTKGKKRRRRNPETGLLEDPPDEEPPLEPQQSGPSNGRSADVAGDESKGQIQFLDVHGDMPLIVLDGELYGCKWAEALGTDMIFTKKPNEDEITSPPPNRRILRSLQDWDLAGFGAARLLASKADVEKRTVQPTPNRTTGSADQEPAADPRVVAEAASRTRQADFLNKLNALRFKKGQLTEQPAEIISSSRRRESATAGSIIGVERPRSGRGSRGGRIGGSGRGRGRGRSRGSDLPVSQEADQQDENMLMDDMAVDPDLEIPNDNAMDQT